MSRARAIWRASACALYLLLLSQARAGVRAEASTAQIADNVVTLEAPSPPVNATEGKKESIAKVRAAWYADGSRVLGGKANWSLVCAWARLSLRTVPLPALRDRHSNI